MKSISYLGFVSNCWRCFSYPYEQPHGDTPAGAGPGVERQQPGGEGSRPQKPAQNNKHMVLECKSTPKSSESDRRALRTYLRPEVAAGPEELGKVNSGHVNSGVGQVVAGGQDADGIRTTRNFGIKNLDPNVRRRSPRGREVAKANGRLWHPRKTIYQTA